MATFAHAPFQALVNAASLCARVAVRSRRKFDRHCRPGGVAATDFRAAGYGQRGRLPAYVPHNQHDLVFAAFHRGMEPWTKAFRKLNGSVRTEKDIRPMRIETLGDDPPTLHYLYLFDATTFDPNELLRTIRPSVRDHPSRVGHRSGRR